MFNFWWSDERSEQKTLTKMLKKPKKGPLSHQKIKCSFLDTVQLLMIGWAIQAKNVNWNAKKWKRPPKSSKIKMFVFGLHSTSHDRPIWSMDLNPICHPSPANKIKCSFLDYIQLLMICQAGQWTQTPSATPLQPKKWNAHFWILFNFWWSAERSKQKTSTEMQKNEKGPLSHQKLKCLFLDYIQLLMIGRSDQWTWTPSATPLQPKNEMLIFGLHSTSDDLPGWSMDSNPIRHPSPTKKMKCSFLDYIHDLPGWSKTPSATPLNQKNEMLIFGSCPTPDDWPGWQKLEPHLPPPKSKK